MFQNIKKTGRLLAIMGIGAVLLASCDINSAQNAFKKIHLLIGLKPINTTVSGVFQDAKTGNLIPSVTLSFIGSGAGDVIDMFSDPISQQTFSGGFATFGISNNVTPSPASPDSFTVVAQAPGYVTAYQKVFLSDTTHYGFAMTMVNTSNPPAGVNSGSNTSAQTTSSGAVAQSYSVQTQASADAPTTASMDVPASTVMTDANGNPLTGTLTTHMSYYADSASALSQLPGGFNNGQVTSGFTKISITDASGHKAVGFSKPITIHTEISSKMINPQTGSNYKIGDSLRVQNYDKTTGQWNDVGMAYVSGQNSDGNYDVTYQTPVYATAQQKNGGMDYVAGAGGLFTLGSDFISTQPINQTVKNGATIIIKRNGYTSTISGKVDGGFVGQSLFTQNFSLPAGKNQFTIKNVPKNITADLFISVPAYVESNFYLQLSGVLYISDPTTGTYTYTLPAAPSNTINVTFTVQPKCSDPTKNIYVSGISTATLAYKSDSAPKTAAWTQVPISKNNWQQDPSTKALTGATVTVSGLINGQSYTFKLALDDKTYTQDITISGSTMAIPETISGSYCK